MESVIKNQSSEVSGTAMRAEKAVFIALSGSLIVGYLYTIIWGCGPYSIPILIWILRLISSVIAIHLGRLWKRKIFLLLFAFVGYQFLRTWTVDPGLIFTEEGSTKLLAGFWMCTACFGLGYILKGKELKRFLAISAAVWTIGMMVYSGIGLYAAWTDIVVDGPGVGAWWNQFGHFARYELIYVPTTSGNILSLGAMIALIALLSTKNLPIKIFYLIAFLELMLMISLTISRTAEVAVSTGIGAAGGIALFNQLNKRNKRRIWLNRVVSICLAGGIAAIALVGVMKLPTLFNHLKQSGSLLMNTALAEAEEGGKGIVVSRGLLNNGQIELSGRGYLWAGVLNYLKEHPMDLLLGRSICSPLADFGELSIYEHCHNGLLQVFLESGLIGLSMILCLLVTVFIRAIRIIGKDQYPLWAELIPALVAAIWVGDLAECFTYFRASQIPIGAFMFIAMGIICALGEKDKERCL